MDRLILFIATGGGAGYLPRAPGTWGSLVGVALWFALRNLAVLPYLSVIAALFVVGTLCAGSAEKIIDRADPGLVVVDEIVGQMLALLAAPHHPGAVLLGFLFFRLFDILKPFPAGWLDRHIHGGLGIMLDDVVAGLYSLLLLQIVWRYLLP
ncbi:MAG TPA: phosphatidylglycerophosphatase A [Desulfobulbaceae bacterium]|nr:phosphatidylglycerophosphatase A [Desulfobulbaceae bacterium]